MDREHCVRLRKDIASKRTPDIRLPLSILLAMSSHLLDHDNRRDCATESLGHDLSHAASHVVPVRLAALPGP